LASPFGKETFLDRFAWMCQEMLEANESLSSALLLFKGRQAKKPNNFCGDVRPLFFASAFLVSGV
jgi:hypothetical protein